ncbi:hypothetical protein [uncultured Ferrovibrio sp.]|jgi:hypothetical protein|uniref:hypothetical protein n=1 Tax=uncultured Ferrovibrio sp. TaxID=1576913 RepID=UPI00261E72A9|nr:hypothetical protein [uncultured Ferrovibrio sp.]
MSDLTAELRDIERKLFEIPDEKVAQLTLLIERSRAVVLSAAMADAALGTLRPRLVKTRPPRHLTLQRIFCHPFEDLLVLPEDGDKQFGRISRASVAPCWDFVLSCLDQAAVKELEASLRASSPPAIGASADPRIAKFGATLWNIAARRLREEIDRANNEPPHREALIAKLGGETPFLDLVDMLGALEIAGALEKLRDELSPKPVGKLLPEQIEAIREDYTALCLSGAAMPGMMIAVVLARTSDPFQLLPVFDALGDQPTGIEGVKPGQFVRRMISGDSRRFFKSIGRANAEKLGDSNIAAMVDDFVRMIGRLKADGIADGPQPEMEAAEARLREMVKTGVLAGADTKIMAALDAPRRDDPSAAQEALFEAKLQAENRAFALQKVAKVANEIGAEKEVASALKTLTQQIEQGGAALIADIKSGKFNGLGKDAAKQQLYGAVRMLELVGGAQAASRLMKDGLTAIDKLPA